ncbi:MAG: carbamate kinase [Bilophila wadsworthia]
MSRKLAVIAIGGNSLIKHRDKQSVEDQYCAVRDDEHIADVIQQGWQVLITHGNGPQVGFIMLRSEIARAVAGMHIVPLVSCVADTQGAIGYQIQQSLDNVLKRRGLTDKTGRTVSLVTQVRVDIADPGFSDPDKFVGEFYAEDQLAELHQQHPDWILKPDANRGWRRVVPSPKPCEIIELDAIKNLLDSGFNVVAVGGGGIPVVRMPEGLFGVDAVIDKDLASSLLATQLGADMLAISTGVESVALNYGTLCSARCTTSPSPKWNAISPRGTSPPEAWAPKSRPPWTSSATAARKSSSPVPNISTPRSRRERAHILPKSNRSTSWTRSASAN